MNYEEALLIEHQIRESLLHSSFFILMPVAGTNFAASAQHSVTHSHHPGRPHRRPVTVEWFLTTDDPELF